MSDQSHPVAKHAHPQTSMSAARWRRVADVFAAVSISDTENRPAILDRECADDEGLRAEVQSLLDAHDRPGPVDQLPDLCGAPAALRARMGALGWEGRRVAQYCVLQPLGAGAMGVVYKARDERLGRYVALKFLPAHLSAESTAKQRFLLEARAAAALDHPSICTVHEIGEASDGQLFIAMPLYEGETLEARLQRGCVALREAVGIALQVAEGLARAHERGVVHRDVKPSNVMLLGDGAVKVLDFGVARVEDVTLTTQHGVTIGTVAYMSPEQARGEPVDNRTDIWSLGVLLYEMVLGTRPFRGENAQAVALAVRDEDPQPLTSARPELPFELDTVIARALAKAREQRYASMTCMATDLAALVDRVDLRPVDPARHPDPGRSASGERRRAAVLVSVVSDYNALVEQLDPRSMEDIMSSVREIALDVVRRHGGLLNHVLGDELIALFGIPTGHEDDDLRAIRAAMELHARVQEACAARAGPTGAIVQLQSGVHAGQLVAHRLQQGARHYEVTGGSARVAARLASFARRGSILISPECQRVVGAFFLTEPHAPVAVDPDAGTITPHRVLGESGVATRLEAAARKGLSPFSGRNAELMTLESQFAQTCAGRGQVVVITGDAGVGKSRTLCELRERISGADVRILHGRCRSYGGVAPYQPFIEMLREALYPQAHESRAGSINDTVARILAIDPSLERFARLYLHMLSMVSEPQAPPRHGHDEQLQSAIPEALAALLTLLARIRPMVLLLEDWHWADEGSREALRRSAEMAAAHALMIVVTTRPQRGETLEWEHASRIQLGPLDFEASLAIMRGVLRVERVSQELACRVYERSAGNPFFLEETCHALLERGSVAARDGEGIAAGGVEMLCLPDTVQAVIRARLDALDPGALEILRVAAVIGREFEPDILHEVLGAQSAPTLALERLSAAGLIQQISLVPQRAYRFKHVLTQEVTYDSLLGHQRRALHGLTGRALERRYAERLDEQAEVLAYHFRCAQEWPSAVEYGARAAERALSLSQFADALAMLDEVCEWMKQLPDEAGRYEAVADVLLRQERLCETLGQRGRQQEIISELIALLAPRGASARLAQTYLRQGDLATLLKRFDAADRALSTALRMGRERGDATLERHALRSIGLLRWHEGRHAEALVMTEGALAIDRERGDDLAVACDLTNVGVILKCLNEPERAIARFEEALAMPALSRDPSRMLYSLQSLANVYRSQGDLERALEHLERADEYARGHLLPIQRSFHITAIAHIRLQQGRIEESLRTYEEAVALSRRARHADGLVQSLRTLGEVLHGLGRAGDALPHLKEAAQLFGQLEDRAAEVDMWSRVATILEQSRDGDPGIEEAAETWERVRNLRRNLGDVAGELDALEGLARIARRRASSPGEAILRVEAALALAATLGKKEREVALRNTLGILEWESGRYAQALRHYELALALARNLGDRAREGLTLNSLGVTLSRLRRHEEARTILEESIRLNRATGQRVLEGHGLAALGDVCREVGRKDAATRYYEQSLALRRALGDTRGEEAMLRRLAEARAGMSGRAQEESDDATLHH